MAMKPSQVAGEGDAATGAGPVVPTNLLVTIEVYCA
jgi:hypothetical protein